MSGRDYWREQSRMRRTAKAGDLVHFGKTDFGTRELVLPIVRITKTRLVCSDGSRTESAMIESARQVGYRHSGAVRIVTAEQAIALATTPESN